MRSLLIAAALLPAFAASPPLSPGFDHFYNLEFPEAIAAFEAEIRRSPKEAAPYNHLAQALLYQAMHRAGALESELVSGNNFFLSKARVAPPEAEQRRFDEAIDKAIALSQSRVDANTSDARAYYTLGVAHGLRANYNFLIRKAWRDALREFTHSRRVHQKALAIDPGFIDAQLVGGVHDYIVGSLPFTWKLLGFLVGFRGDKDGGLKTVERIAASEGQTRIDAMILLAVAYRRERRWVDAVPLLTRLIAMFPRHYLYRLELVQMYGDLGRKDDALGVLAEMERLHRTGAKGYRDLPPGKIHYARGNLLFWYRDYEGAIAELTRVTDRGGEAGWNALGNAWLRRGQANDMLRRRESALAAYRAAIDAVPDSDAAREARRYLSSPFRRTDP